MVSESSRYSCVMYSFFSPIICVFHSFPSVSLGHRDTRELRFPCLLLGGQLKKTKIDSARVRDETNGDSQKGDENMETDYFTLHQTPDSLPFAIPRFRVIFLRYSLFCFEVEVIRGRTFNPLCSSS